MDGSPLMSWSRYPASLPQFANDGRQASRRLMPDHHVASSLHPYVNPLSDPPGVQLLLEDFGRSSGDGRSLDSRGWPGYTES